MAFMGLKYAEDLQGRKVIRGGKVISALVQLYADGQQIKSAEIAPNYYPFQVNRMDIWFERAVAQVGTREVFDAIRRIRTVEQREIRTDINDGLGRKEGREASTNRFSYYLDGGSPSFKIDVTIRTYAYASITKNKVKAGIHTPKPRKLAQPELVAGKYMFFNDSWYEKTEDGGFMLLDQPEVEQLIQDGILS